VSRAASRNCVKLGAQTIKKIEAAASAAVAAGHCPGVVVLIAIDGQVVLERAWGHAMLEPERRPMRIDTIFDLASLTKCLSTALLVMTYVDDGLLSLRDPARKFIPEFSGGGKDTITLLDLLTHVTGLSDSCLYHSDHAMQNRTDDIWGAICASAIASPLRSRYRYQDANYIVLGKILEAVARTGLDTAFDGRVAKPLSLRDTGFLPSDEKQQRIAATEQVEGRVLVGLAHDPRARQLGGVAGHAGLFGTAREVFKMIQMLLDAGATRRRRLLSVASARLMSIPLSPPGLHPRCIGWDTDPFGEGPRGDLFSTNGFGHTGFTGTSVWADRPSRTVIVILSNRVHPHGRGSVVGLRRQIANLVAGATLNGS
jgi:CubicO group peptidase (beta-lactamase class C family)